MNIDKLKEEVIMLRTKMFYILGLIMMFLAGIGSLYGRFVDGSKSNGFVLSGVIVLLILLKVSAIMYLKTKDAYEKKLVELKEEK